MTLLPGTHLGPYNIIGTLGAGGMGEVYRAHDRTLGRDVAIKILPGQWLADAERRSRFEREARVLASLNHPHIGAIYGLEESGDSRALVLELIEGPTLADYIHTARVGRPGLPVQDALAIAQQIADALDAAHERGIVHRDLKPGNVLLQGASRTDSSHTGHVTAKVVDFGLAKTAADDGLPDISQSPTMTGVATKQGMLLGTAAYMSPEQARGRAVDKRADIWAFGCVLYEMLAGRSPFTRDTVADTFAAIVEREPEWAGLPSDTPSHVRELIARCLEKDPRRRLRDIGDARLDLDRAGTVPATTPAAVQPSRRRLAGIAALTAVIVAGIIAATWMLARQPTPAGTMRLSVVAPQGTRFTQRDITEHPQFALSPDGTRIAVMASAPGARPQIWVRSLESGIAQPVAGTDDASGPFWSPDGQSLGYFARGRLWTVSLGGAAPQSLAELATDVATGAWSPDGVILFPSGNGGALLRVPAGGGTVAPATTLDEAQGETAHRWPQFLPGGRRFIYLVGATRPAIGGVYVGSLDAPTRTRILTSATSATYVEPGYLLFEQNGTLTRQKFDAAAGVLTGEPEPLADRILGLRGPSYLPLSAARNGTIAYWNAPLTPTELLWFDRTGRPLGKVGADNVRYDNPVLSPDGSTLLVTLRDNPNINNLMRFDLSSGAGSRLTFIGGVARFAVWAPDSREIAYSVNIDGLPQLFRRDASGAGEEAIIKGVGSHYAMFPDDWSRHGRILVVVAGRTGFDVWSLDVAAGKAEPYLASRNNEVQARLSPDGRWVAYTSDESGVWETYVQGFGQTRGKWLISSGGGSQPMWRSDGRELFFIGADGRLLAVPVTTSGTFAHGVASPLFKTSTPQILAPFRTGYAVSPDGQRFLITSLRLNAEPSAITVVLNSTAK
jgi:eukaryotic-like serine/threonine-protein kinase